MGAATGIVASEATFAIASGSGSFESVVCTSPASTK